MSNWIIKSINNATREVTVLENCGNTITFTIPKESHTREFHKDYIKQQTDLEDLKSQPLKKINKMIYLFSTMTIIELIVILWLVII